MAPAKGNKTVRVAVTQHEPEWLDLEASVQKTCRIIEEAAKGGAQLVAFPELWIPGYPAWIWSRPVDFELGTKYVQNSLKVDSDEMRRIADCAGKNKIAVALGFSENDADSVYIAQALINDKGEVEMTRRKMKPTHMERTVFGDASGECLASVVELPALGKVGSLSCWEHTQPLLKYHVMAQKEQIHVAAWPVLDPFITGSPGLWSMSIEGCRSLSQTYAVESQSYVLHATTALSEKGVELMKTAGSPIMGMAIPGSSAVIGPDGRVVTDPAASSEHLIFSDLNMNEHVRAKTFIDISGHYSRPDMLWLGADAAVKKHVRGPATTTAATIAEKKKSTPATEKNGLPSRHDQHENNTDGNK